MNLFKPKLVHGMLHITD